MARESEYLSFNSEHKVRDLSLWNSLSRVSRQSALPTSLSLSLDLANQSRKASDAGARGVVEYKDTNRGRSGGGSYPASHSGSGSGLFLVAKPSEDRSQTNGRED